MALCHVLDMDENAAVVFSWDLCKSFKPSGKGDTMGKFMVSYCNCRLIKHCGCTSVWLEYSLYCESETSLFYPLINFSSSPYSLIISLLFSMWSKSFSVDLWVIFLWLVYNIILFSSKAMKTCLIVYTTLIIYFLVVVYIFLFFVNLSGKHNWFLILKYNSSELVISRVGMYV